MGFFKKLKLTVTRSFKSIREYSDTWNVSQGLLDGRPIFVRFREGLLDAVAHPGFPFQIGIAVPLLNPSRDGLTTEVEAEELNIIEDQLERTLIVGDEAVLSLVITYNGMREFVFYASKWDPKYFEDKVRVLAQECGGHKLQFMMQPDENWETFKQFAI